MFYAVSMLAICRMIEATFHSSIYVRKFSPLNVHVWHTNSHDSDNLELTL